MITKTLFWNSGDPPKIRYSMDASEHLIWLSEAAYAREGAVKMGAPPPVKIRRPRIKREQASSIAPKFCLGAP